ncbi:unnamed protein product [Urochloa humidicola]
MKRASSKTLPSLVATRPQLPSPSRLWAEANRTHAAVHRHPSLTRPPPPPLPRQASTVVVQSWPRPSSRAAVGCRPRRVSSGHRCPKQLGPPRGSAAVGARSGPGKRCSGAGRFVAATDPSCSAFASSIRSARGRRVQGAVATPKHAAVASSVGSHAVVCRREGNLEKAGCPPRSEGGRGGGLKKEAGSSGWSSGPVGEAGCRGRKRRHRGSPVTSEESSTARSARRPAKQCAMMDHRMMDHREGTRDHRDP